LILSNHPLKTDANKETIPRHIAIIMDGNGRWAQRRGKPRTAGHRAGINAVRRVVEACGDLGVKALTLYAFSTENWKRPAREVSFIMRLLQDYIDKEMETLHRNNTRLQFPGRQEGLPGAVLASMERGVRLTAANTGSVLSIALNYGGRAEIVDATRSVMRAVERRELNPDDLNEIVFNRFLYTADLPDPDLTIRTSGEYRLSNFLIWQNAHALVWITPTLWPDFGSADLQAAINAWHNSRGETL